MYQEDKWPLYILQPDLKWSVYESKPLWLIHGQVIDTDVACSLLALQPQRQNELLDVPGSEEGDEDISGTQFVCETVIRSLTLEEEPERKPQCRTRPNIRRHDGELPSAVLVLAEFRALLVYPKDISDATIILLI